MATATDELFGGLLESAREQGLSFVDPAPPKDGDRTVDGLRLHYLDWGIAGNLPMVLMHGRAVTAHSWDFFSLTMRPHFHVYALDHRGHGDSAWAADGDYRRERHADDLVAFVDALRLDSIVLVGHSMGGAVSLLAALRLTDKLRAMVIVDSTLGPRRGPSPVGQFIEGPDVFPSLEAFAAHAHRFNPRRDPTRLLASLRHNTMQLPDGNWTWKYDKRLRDPRHPSSPPDYPAMWQSLQTVPCPVLIVRAGERSHINDDLLPEIHSLAPRVQLVTVPDAGHSVMGDNPKGFAAAVATFLKNAGAMEPSVGAL